MKTRFAPIAVALFLNGTLQAGDVPLPRFRAVEIDNKIEIGYGVTVADVDGDRKPDILLADKKQFVWYRNPTWEKFILAENLTKFDNVCIAARDIDWDGKAEVAVGAEWNPNDTTNSGAVFYLIAPQDRTNKWEAVELPHEPTVHRMCWVSAYGKFDLVVVPLHGRGNKDGEGAGVRILAYKLPANPREPWKTELIHDAMHMTHSIQAIGTRAQMLVSGKEGVILLSKFANEWKFVNEWDQTGLVPTVPKGAGEVRLGQGPRHSFIATIEPMHGNEVVVYHSQTLSPVPAVSPYLVWQRTVIDSSLKEGHALACGNLLGLGSDQIIAGWRAKNDDGKVGIKLYVLLDYASQKWKETLVDDNTMACEDLCLADLNDDNKLDIVASGRATKNVKIYFNETGL